MTQPVVSELSLDAVLCTPELNRRPSRPPNHAVESRALLALAQHLANSPSTILQKLADVALESFGAGSAGVSLVSPESGDFYWPAIAGAWHPQIGGGTPRNFGPCGIVLDRDAVQLFARPERHYPYLMPASPIIHEVLLSPFYSKGQAVGTIWVVSHDEGRTFDREDQRLLESLATFASAAFETQQSLRDLEQERLRLSSRDAETALAREFAEATLRTSPVPLLVLESDLRIVSANEAFYARFQVEPGTTEGRMVYDLGNRQWDIPRLRTLLEEILSLHRALESFEVTHEFESIGRRTMLLNARRMEVEPGGRERIVLVIADITDRKIVEETLQANESRQRFLLTFGDALRDLSDPLAVQDTAARLLGEHLQLARVHYGETQGDELVIDRNYCNGLPPLLGRFLTADYGARMYGDFLAGRINSSTDVDIDSAIEESERLALKQLGIRAYLGVPLVKRGEWVAILGLHSTAPHVWTAEERSLITDVAERTWAAVERTRAEDALRANEAFNRSLMDGSADCLKVLDIAGRLLHMNGPGLCLMEIDDFEPLCGLEWWSLWPSGSREELQRAVNSATSGRIYSFEGYCPTVKGTLKWWEVKVSPVRENDGGPVVRLLAISRDITERKRTEDLMVIQKQTFEMAASAAPLQKVLESLAAEVEQHSREQTVVAIHLLDESGTHFERTAGVNLPEGYAEAVDGMAVNSMTGPCCAAIVRQQRVTVTDVASDTEFPKFAAFALPAGIRAGWSTPIISSFGKVLGTIAYYYRETHRCGQEDDALAEIVTRTVGTVIERARAEEALRESEARFRMVADNMAQLAWTCNSLGDVTWYNQRWLDFTGLSFEEMKGWGWKHVQHPDHVERVIQRVEHSRDTGEPWEDTFPLRAKDSTYRWFLSRALPIRDSQGRIVQWFGTNTDVTDQLAAEEALKDADRRKDEFLATLAHELRNPLAPIRSSIHILTLQAQGNETIGEVTEMLDRQVHHMVRLVDDLMEVSRISRGKIELRKEQTSLAAIIRSAVDTSNPLIAAANHQLAISLPSEPVPLFGDPVRLAQVVANLLNNSAKYTDRGGQIWLSAERQTQDVVIRVRDTGIGIAAESLPRVFEMFMQVDRSSSRSQSGLGIGLTLVKRLVEMHGGTITAQSAGRGKGSEFSVRLPCQHAESSTGPAAATPTLSVPLKHRVLVVDDNRDAATSLAMLIQVLGSEVKIASGGPEALSLLQEFQPDVVLLDLGMPQMDGYEVARRIRQSPQSDRVVLIALTGWGQQDDRDRTRAAGFDHHLVKPASMTQLQTVLSNLETR